MLADLYDAPLVVGQSGREDLLVVAGRHVAVLALEVFHERHEGVAVGHLLGHGQYLHLGFGLHRVGLAVHGVDAQRLRPRQHVVHGKGHAPCLSRLYALAQFDVVAVDSLKSLGRHREARHRAGTVVPHVAQDGQRRVFGADALVGYRLQGHHGREFSLLVLHDEDHGQRAQVRGVLPQFPSAVVGLALAPQEAAAGSVVGIERGDGDDVFLQVAVESHQERVGVVGNGVGLVEVDGVPPEAHFGRRLRSGQLVAVEGFPDEAFVGAVGVVGVPSGHHAHHLAARVGAQHVGREHHGAAHARVVLHRETVVGVDRVGRFGVAEVEQGFFRWGKVGWRILQGRIVRLPSLGVGGCGKCRKERNQDRRGKKSFHKHAF